MSNISSSAQLAGQPPAHGSPQAATLTKSSFSNFEDHINYERNLTAEKHPISGQTDNPDAWPTLSKTLRAFDEAKLESYKDDVDTLLVFAGLFSAILAAFSIESYKLLQPDSNQITIQLLAQISQQLNSFTVTGSPSSASVNSSFQTTSSPFNSDFKPHASIICINFFWFLGLILSLATASLGMLVKQWLREYLANDSTSPQALTRIRYSRHINLERWHVFTIAGCLPSLLQGALASFFIALCLFMWQFHYILFCLVTTAVVVWFLFYTFVLIAPVFSSHCPYKSPSLKSTTHSIRLRVHKLLREVLRVGDLWNGTLSFLDPGPLREETDIRVNSEKDEAIWTEADALFFDDKLVKETIHVCLANIDGPDMVECVRGISKRRELKEEPANLLEFGQDSVSLALVNTLTREIRNQVDATESLTWKPWMGDAYSLLLENWEFCSSDVGKNHLADFILSTIQQDWILSEHILRWNPTLSLPVLIFTLQDTNESLRGIHYWDLFHLVRQVMRSIRALITLGPMPSTHLDGTSVQPTFYNLAAVTKALLTCFTCADPFKSRVAESQSHVWQLVSEIEALVDDLLSISRKNLEDNDYFRQWALEKGEDWSSVVSEFSQTLSKWAEEHNDEPSREADFAKLSSDIQKKKAELHIT